MLNKIHSSTSLLAIMLAGLTACGADEGAAPGSSLLSAAASPSPNATTASGAIVAAAPASGMAIVPSAAAPPIQSTTAAAPLSASLAPMQAGASVAAVNSRIAMTTSEHVRSSAGGARLQLRRPGDTGTILRGPVTQDGLAWWNIDFDTGSDGWVRGTSFSVQGSPAPTPTPTATPTPPSTLAPRPTPTPTPTPRPTPTPTPTPRPTPTPTPTPTPAPTPTPSPTPTPPPQVGGIGSADAFINPDDGNIPDRAQHPLAFPTAIGFGKATAVRASNAVVYKINSLDDVADPNDGKITYRECALALAVNTPYQIAAGRPRYCVFEVAGAIIIQSPIRITTPKIYIAGQTSPGGIEFRLGSNYNPVDALIDTRPGGDHMILRHVRARVGEHPGRTSINGDPIRINRSRFQIVDHVSSMFGTDESFELADCTNCTVQWSIIGPNICRDAGHTSALHCKTFFIKPSDRVTVAYNLTQHGEQRGMNVAPGVSPVAANTTSQADIFNNVIYHFVEEGGLLSNQFASPYVNYIGNVYLRGPRYQASQPNYLLALYSGATSNPRGFSVHMKNNVTPRQRLAGQFGQSVTDPFLRSVGLFSGVSASQVCGLNANGTPNCSVNGVNVVQDTSPVRAPGVATQQFEPWMISTPEQAMRNVLTFAGADLCRHGACRDNVDQLYVEDVQTCDRAPYLFETGWTSTVAASGGFARISSTGPAPSDRDNDGMPDFWESMYRGTNPNVWDANADPDGDGYPNIEEYLNFIANDHARYRGVYSAGMGALPAYNCGRPMA